VSFLTIEEVLAAHARVKRIPISSAADHVHRMDLLESAVARPQNAAAYEDADLVTQAATLMWGLVRNHPFSDGNERTALISTIVFLDINAHTLDMSEDEKFELVVGIANAHLTVEQTADTLRARIRPDKGPAAISEGVVTLRKPAI
jgi:death-on-curing protein